ncbi:hypothetical protein GGS26DRAFT_565242 [Hypomontagnella submonticulosa]|nr:hypothetical protein GGS26DRAFT_565242 [Hypomontagnella submonticulosa]
MGRWSYLDGDEDRLPAGMTRIGYDADDQTYTFRDTDGSIWESAPGNKYGRLSRISGPPKAIDKESSSSVETTVYEDDPYSYEDETYNEGMYNNEVHSEENYDNEKSAQKPPISLSEKPLPKPPSKLFMASKIFALIARRRQKSKGGCPPRAPRQVRRDEYHSRQGSNQSSLPQDEAPREELAKDEKSLD